MGNEEDTQTVGEVGNVSFGKYIHDDTEEVQQFHS